MSGYVTTGPTAIPVPEAPAPPDAGTHEAGTPEQETRRRRRIILLFVLLALLLLVIGLAVWYLLFRQPIPLPLPNAYTPPAYSTSFYGSTLPVGVAVSPNGDRIYATETGADRGVVVFDGAGNQVGTATPPASTGTDHVPVWVAIDPITSSIYVSDRPTGSIYVYDRDGAYQRTVTLTSPINGWQPMGLAFDAAGNLYVTDLGGAAARIEMFDRSLNLVRTFGEGDRLSFPNSLAVDKAGNLFVADSNNGRLLAFRSDGTLLAQVGRGTGVGELGLPRGIAVDGQGRVYVGDATAQGVLVFRFGAGSGPAVVGPDAIGPFGWFGGRTYIHREVQRGLPGPGQSADATPGTGATLEYLGFFGGPGSSDGQFAFPNGVAADGRGRIYVSDTSNNRIQMWSY